MIGRYIIAATTEKELSELVKQRNSLNTLHIVGLIKVQLLKYAWMRFPAALKFYSL